MSLFLFGAAALLGLTVLLLWRSVTGKAAVNQDDSGAKNIEIARYRLEQYRRSAQPDAQQEKHAIEAALLDDLAMLTDGAPRPDRHPVHPVAAALVLAGIPLAAIGVYALVGNPGSIVTALPAAPPNAQYARPGENTPGDGLGEPEQARLDSLIRQLETTLAARPDEIQGWALAARTYLAMGKYQQAASAFSNLNRLQPNDADTLAGWADALIRGQRGRYTEAANNLVRQALAIDADHGPALWLAAIGSFSSGDAAQALKLLARLKQTARDDPAALLHIEQMIGTIREAQSSDR